MPHKYSLKYDKEKTARAVLRAASISLKKSIETCNFIRGKKVSGARNLLEEVIKGKRAIPFKRFTNGAGHKRGMGAGKYPKKAAAEFVKLLNVVEANAQNKGLSTSDLIITHICANKAAKQAHYGRKRGRIMKRTHIEVYVKESEEKKRVKKKVDKKEEKKDVPVKEEKPVEENKEIPKTEDIKKEK